MNKYDWFKILNDRKGKKIMPLLIASIRLNYKYIQSKGFQTVWRTLLVRVEGGSIAASAFKTFKLSILLQDCWAMCSASLQHLLHTASITWYSALSSLSSPQCSSEKFDTMIFQCLVSAFGWQHVENVSCGFNLPPLTFNSRSFTVIEEQFLEGRITLKYKHSPREQSSYNRQIKLCSRQAVLQVITR